MKIFHISSWMDFLFLWTFHHFDFLHIDCDLTTHFLLINMDNEVQDISLDKEKSPGLEYSDISFEGKVF